MLVLGLQCHLTRQLSSDRLGKLCDVLAPHQRDACPATPGGPGLLHSVAGGGGHASPATAAEHCQPCGLAAALPDAAANECQHCEWLC